jgi:hypothetical protein
MRKSMSGKKWYFFMGDNPPFFFKRRGLKIGQPFGFLS